MLRWSFVPVLDMLDEVVMQVPGVQNGAFMHLPRDEPSNGACLQNVLNYP